MFAKAEEREEPGRGPDTLPTMDRSSLRLGIDLDGVVADFNAGWTALHNAEFGGALTPDLVTSWNDLHTVAGFDEMNAFWEWARPNPVRRSVFRHLDLLPQALDTLRMLDDAGHRIVIITTKPDWAIQDTLHWLADNMIPTREVHLTDTKHEVDCDVYLDDSPVVLPGLVAHRPHATTCRFVRPWNAPLEGAHDIGSWPEFHALVTERTPQLRPACE